MLDLGSSTKWPADQNAKTNDQNASARTWVGTPNNDIVHRRTQHGTFNTDTLRVGETHTVRENRDASDEALSSLFNVGDMDAPYRFA